MTDITKRLRDDAIYLDEDCELTEMAERIRGAADEIERLRAALAFYADEANWCDPACAMAWTGCEPALQDHGGRARTALRRQG